MKSFNEYEDEIYKCSRCGLCQSVCPVYKITHNECSVSRAKFNILNGIIKRELDFDKQVKSYLDLCTGCNACKKFCPSGIDVVSILISAKNEYYKKNKLSLVEKFLNSYFVFKLALRLALVYFSVIRIFHLDKIFCLLEVFFSRFVFLGKFFILFNSFVKQNYKYKPCPKKISKKYKAIYFKGCFNKYLNSETYDAVTKIFENLDIELIEKNFECCGVSYLNDGLIDNFKELINKNISLLDEDYDYVLTDCASCNFVLKDYKTYLSNEKTIQLTEKTVSVIDLIENVKFFSKSKMNVAVHIPCHESSNLLKIVQNIGNINLVMAKDYDKCCGFSGKFALKNSEISKEISRRKIQNYIDSGADIILTTCPACILGLKQGCIEINAKNCSNRNTPEVMNLFVFLAKYCC